MGYFPIKQREKEMFRFSRTTTLSAVILGMAVIFLASPSTVMAQDVATGSATATIATALTVVATSALAFGTTYQGVPVVVARTVAEAGIFTISGQANAGISCYLQMPEYISIAGDSDRMVIAFSTTDCTIDTALAASPGDPTGAGIDGYVGIDPYNLPDGVNLSDNGFCGVYIGGKIIPTVDQTAGSYTGSIILTVAYTGV
jgi:hypothetical protein